MHGTPEKYVKNNKTDIYNECSVKQVADFTVGDLFDLQGTPLSAW